MTIRTSDRFLRVLCDQPVDRPPVWLMRQAGRYLPEYRAVRGQVRDFLELCHTPELATEVTLQPLRRYPLDAAILFQDILTLPNAMGAPLTFVKGEGPVFTAPIQDEKSLAQLRDVLPEQDMPYVCEEIKLICKELDGKLPLIGFCGSPWTVACYMVEGQISKQFSTIRRMQYQAPNLLHGLLQKLADNSVRYLKAQIDSGAQAVMIFDTWGGILPYRAFSEFSMNYMQQMIQKLKASPKHADVPVIVFTKQAAHRYEDLAAIGAQAIGTDWTLPLSQIRQRVGPEIVLQGNLDPFVLLADDKVIQQEVKWLLDDYGQAGRHIFNLGHGMMPEMSPAKVDVLLEALHTASSQYYAADDKLKRMPG